MKPRPREGLRLVAVVVVAMLVALGLARTNWHRAIENLYTDWWHVLSGVRYAPRHTAIVAIDDQTLLALKDDPYAFWAPHFGTAFGVLTQAGAMAIGVDFIYQVSAEGWLRKLDIPDSQASRSYDAPLREALARGNIVLITQLVTSSEGSRLLAPPDDQLVMLPGGANDLGAANLFPDEDKHVRRFLPVLVADEKNPVLSFAWQLAKRVAGAPLAPEDGPRAIGFTGPPGTVLTVSMRRLLEPNALQDPAVRALKGKVVIVAATNTGSDDRHFTPYSRGASAELMPGGEIHANIVETILSGRYPRVLSPAIEIAYLAVILSIAAVFFLRLRASRAAVLALAACVALAFPSWLLFQSDWIVPVAEPQAGILAALLMTLGLRLTGEERERARIREMFGKYVSDEVVDKLLSDERRPDLGGEALTVTVLFSDIRGFTTISEKLTAHEVVEMLNAYFTRVCAPILEQGGTVDKFIGDAVMAVFGSPVRHADHARRAVRAALGMADEAEGFKKWMRERFPDRGLHEFGVGVGLHTGEAVIGDIGTPRRKEFTAIGDTVNAASRLEGATKEVGCTILASDATVKAAGAGVRTGKSERIMVKGKAEPLAVHEIVALDDG